ncbi:MAG: SLBB domain-containing protein [Gammaproteobacteria bacterium]|nr:SLBB domain-containing protein [Gammaproteobacteria bacterium]
MAALALFAANATAITPSPAMLEQFKQIPKSEQQRLMKQYGISPPSGTQQQQQSISNPTVVTERSANQQQTSQQVKEGIAPVVTAITTADGPEKVIALKRFGYDMFAGEPTTFAPVSDVPVPSDYLMGPGDVIKIQIYGKDNKQYSLVVARSGNIQLPELGPVSVMGLSFEELKRILTRKIKERYIGVESSISLGELRSIRIIIAGESYKPGTYSVSALSTITQALFLSGGINGIGSLRNIQLNRGGKLVGRFDLYELLTKGVAKNDLRLQSGDIIFIPPVGTSVAIKGEVRRPAIYEMKAGENISDLIGLAAGLKANSYPQASLLQTFDKNHLPKLVSVDLMTRQGRKLKLKDGDVLTVKSTTNRVQQQVTLVGAVNRPGVYQWRKGMAISDVIESTWKDLTTNTDLNYALLIRKLNLQGDIELYKFSLETLLKTPNSPDNYVLQPQDKLVIFEQKNSESRRALLNPIVEQLKRQVTHQGASGVATISGEVYFPGEYPITINNRLSDLLIAAGGLKESAHLKRAELISLNTDPDQGAKVSHYDVNLQAVMQNEDVANSFLVNNDRLKVFKIPAWQENLSIRINGEVKFPGTYSVHRGESLNSVIKRAGGYTENAFLAGAVFTREAIKANERKQIAKLADQLRLDIASKGLSSQGPTTSFAESSKMLNELENLNTVGRVVIDLATNNLTVEDGDMLYIPSPQRIITVVGEVQHNSTHMFNNDLELTQYLSLSGGLKRRADDDRIYVIRANGAVMIPSWFGQDKTMQPGDTIVVPLDTEHKDNLTLWAQITKILYNTAVAYAAISGI